MSCEIKSRALINDLTKVKRILFPLAETDGEYLKVICFFLMTWG